MVILGLDFVVIVLWYYIINLLFILIYTVVLSQWGLKPIFSYILLKTLHFVYRLVVSNIFLNTYIYNLFYSGLDEKVLFIFLHIY